MVFDVIRAANGPLSAYDILDRIKPSRPRIAPPTIYRALEHLIAGGLVRRIESLNAYLTADERAPGTVVFAICDDCGRVQQRDAGAEVARLTKALAKDGFARRTRWSRCTAAAAIVTRQGARHDRLQPDPVRAWPAAGGGSGGLSAFVGRVRAGCGLSHASDYLARPDAWL